MDLSYIIGKLMFVETPKTYNEESTLEGKVGVRDGFQGRQSLEARVILWDAPFLVSGRLKRFTTTIRPSLTWRSSY